MIDVIYKANPLYSDNIQVALYLHYVGYSRLWTSLVVTIQFKINLPIFIKLLGISEVIKMNFLQNNLRSLQNISDNFQKKMFIKLFILAYLLIDVSNSQKCRPFGVRLNFGLIIRNSSSPQKLGIRFNTHQQCTNSAVIILHAQKPITKINCIIRQVSIFPMLDSTNYTSYIHQCSITNQIQFGKQFSYNIIDNATSQFYFTKSISLNIKNPLNPNRQVKMLNVADWAVVTAKSRIPIIDHMVAMAQEKSIDCLLLNGDMGYQLNSNAALHESFMNMLEKIASKFPVVYNRGNHQHGLSGYIFIQYFQAYDLIELNATSLNIGPLLLYLFDPLAALIPRLFHRYTIQQRNSSLKYLAQQLQKNQKHNKIKIALTHYPLICSYPCVTHCLPDPKRNQTLPLFINLKQHYSLLLKYRVPLVLSGHVHSYQRSLPLKDNYNFQKHIQKQKFVFNQNSQYFIHVVNGIGGSDKVLFESYDNIYGKKIDQYVAQHAENKTGFGYLTVHNSLIEYHQYEAVSLQKIRQIDYFSINMTKTINPSDSGDSPIDENDL